MLSLSLSWGTIPPAFVLGALVRVVATRHAARRAELRPLLSGEGRLLVTGHDGTPHDIPAGSLRSVRMRISGVAVFEGPGVRFLVDAVTVERVTPADPGGGAGDLFGPSRAFLDLTCELWNANRGLRPSGRYTRRVLRNHGVELIELGE